MSQFEDRVVADTVVHPEMNEKSYSSSSTKVTLNKVKNPKNPRFLLKTLSNKKTSDSKTQSNRNFRYVYCHNIFNLKFQFGLMVFIQK